MSAPLRTRIAPTRISRAGVALLAALLSAAPLWASELDWTAWSDVEQVEVVTRDEDGDLRETTVWIVVVEGRPYIRTGGTRWGGNVERDPNLLLRIEGREIPVRVDFVRDEALRERIGAVFREKYGTFDAFMSLFRGSDPRIMHLTPREEDA